MVGNNSIVQEIELIKLYDSIFSELGFNDLVFKINHRFILRGIADYIGIENNLNEFISIIDKLDKIGSCLLYTSPSPRDRQKSRMPSSA